MAKIGSYAWSRKGWAQVDKAVNRAADAALWDVGIPHDLQSIFCLKKARNGRPYIALTEKAKKQKLRN